MSEAAATTPADASASTQAAPEANLATLGNPQQPAQTTAAAQPGPVSSFAELLDEKGSFKPDWTKSLPEHLKPFEGSLSKYPTPFDAMAGLGNAQKLIGQRQNLKPPGPDATPEQQAAYQAEVRKITGAPETPEGYGLKAPDNLPEGLEWNAELADRAANIAHKYGIPPAALHELIELNNENAAGLAAKGPELQRQEISRQINELTKEWGADAPVAWQQAKRGIAILGGDPNADNYTVKDIMKMALNADKAFREDNGLVNGGSGQGQTFEERAAKLRADPAYQNPKTDADRARQAEIQGELMRIHEAKKRAV